MPRHKRRDAEAAKRAAEAAAPEVITVVFEDVDALGTALRTARLYGWASRPCRCGRSSMEFLNEVCLLEHGGLFKLRGYVPSKPGRSRRSTTPPRAPAPAPAGARTSAIISPSPSPPRPPRRRSRPWTALL